MESLLWVFLIFSFSLLFYVYVFFPSIMYLMKNYYKECYLDVESYKTINVVIPAHNEEKIIAKKLENHMALQYRGEFIITVLCDSCDDETVDIVKRYSVSHPSTIKYFIVEGKKGKTHAINSLMPNVTSDITVFSDANVMLDKMALENVNRALQSDRVGGVAGQLSYVNSDEGGAAASNGLYWRYEEMIKAGEAKCGSLMGADGSIFAIRSSLYRKHPMHVLDDFSTSMGIVIQGYEFKFDENIKAFEKGAEEDSEELQRKIRISNRSYNSYLALRKDIISKLKMYDLVKFYSHKVLRWYSFIFMLFALISSVFLSFYSGLGIFLFLSQFTFYLIAVAHYRGLLSSFPRLRKVSNVIYYFTMANYAAMKGIFQSLNGEKITVWNKAESTR